MKPHQIIQWFVCWCSGVAILAYGALSGSGFHLLAGSILMSAAILSDALCESGALGRIATISETRA